MKAMKWLKLKPNKFISLFVLSWKNWKHKIIILAVYTLIMLDTFYNTNSESLVSKSCDLEICKFTRNDNNSFYAGRKRIIESKENVTIWLPRIVFMFPHNCLDLVFVLFLQQRWERRKIISFNVNRVLLTWHFSYYLRCTTA